MKTIGIQGGRASYHELAAKQMHGDALFRYFETFAAVFAALRDGTIDTAVIAIANNAIGFIPEPYSELIEHPGDYFIIGETYLSVDHALMAPAGAILKDIKEVHSQPPAIEQCRKFLESNLPNARIIEEHDTAGSAQLVAQWNDPAKAAIASAAAAKLYNLQIIEETIQDEKLNITRFLEISLSAKAAPVVGRNKTTILLKTPEKPGALVGALMPFKKQGINLTNLHSRLIPNTAFEMQFFVEFDSGTGETKTDIVFEELDKHGYQTTLLGSYWHDKVPRRDT